MSDQIPGGGGTSQEKQALLAIRRLRARVDELERSRGEPIAVVGMACRFPGGAEDSDSFWQLLAEGRDAIVEVPADRFDINAYYDANPDAPGMISSRWGGYIAGAEKFDASFFGIAPREANSLDPQQRLVLEVAWEALEHAGIAAPRLSGTDAGVFIGMSTQDYAQFQLKHVDAARMDAYFGTGSAMNAAAGRLSYILGLQGPSMVVDTACSSSLVAIHLACQSLRRDESGIALAGGVNFLLMPEITANFSRARMMAPDGRCKTFDADANGYVRGEGCGIVVLKTLSKAQADGDRIFALVRGSAVNQDGRSGGFTAPSELAQQRLIMRAVESAGVKPHEVAYVEAHGTGTSLGDPIEAQALAAALGVGRPSGDRLLIGSAKTNVGHLEAAAGVAGLMKLILALEHEEIPPHLHFKTPNPLIDWNALPLQVTAAASPWPRSAVRRIGGVSSFGFSGTNAHLVVEEAPLVEAPVSQVDRSSHVLALSAKSEIALKELAQRYADVIREKSLPDVCFTANTGRAHFDHRLAITGSTSEEVGDALNLWLSAGAAPRVVSACVAPGPALGVAWAFTGQGSQYAGMGRTLYATQPTFRAALDRCAAILKDQLAQPLLDVLYPAEGARSPIDETGYAQPALFALEYALATLWRSWGIQPAVVLGHSIGEYVAACLAGVFSLEDALTLVAARGRLMQALPAGGTMAAVGASEATVRAAIAGVPAIAIAAVNGPVQVVIAGPQADLARVVATFEASGVTAQPLTTSHAFHSALLEPMLDAFEAVARTVTYHAPQLPVIANLTGQLATGDDLVTPGYWRRHARSTVQWAASLQTLEASGCGIVVEVGPTATLTALGQSQTTISWRPSLRRGREDWTTLIDAVAQLYVAGGPVDWAGFDRDYVRRKVTLPTYPFQRERYWVTVSQTVREAVADLANATHPWLGRRTDLGSGETIFESRIAFDEPSFLADHRILDAVIVPASLFIEMVLAAAGEVLGSSPIDIRELAIDEALMLPRGAARTFQLLLRPDADGGSFEIFSCASSTGRERSNWRRHASGRVSTASMAGESPAEGLDAAVAHCSSEVPSEHLYAQDSLIQLGPAFRGVQRLWQGGNETIGEISLPESLHGDAAKCHAHPALLDACIQAVGPLLPQGDPEAAPGAFVLIGVDRLCLTKALPTHVWAHVSVRSEAGPGGLVVADLVIYDADRQQAGAINGLRFRRVRQETLLRAISNGRESLYTLRWEPKPLDDAPVFRSTAAVVADSSRSFDALRVEHGLDRYESFVAELDQLSLEYVTQAMRDLGWPLEAGDIVDPGALGARLGVVPKLDRLWRRLLEILAEGGIVASTKIGMKVTARSPVAPAHSALAALRERYPERGLDIDVFHRCASRLADVLRGTADPLQLLFPNASLDAVEQLVQHTPIARTLNAVVRDAIEAAIERFPSARPLRILEIGAGTGGTTACVVPMLPAGRVEYVFTDVSPIFLARAREKFADYPFMRYATLDIERDPVAQDFAAHHFDIVIAANVLHATRDLRQTLAHVQQLLASNGMLVLLEVVQRQRAVDLTFGLTDGWWRFEDADLRPAYPLLPAAEWMALLRRVGFATADVIPPLDAPDAPPQAVIISQGSESPQPAAWIVVGNDDVATALARLIRNRGDRCVGISVPDGLERALRGELEHGSRIRGVINVGGAAFQSDSGLNADEIDRAVANECGSALRLIQGLIKADLDPKPRCWFVTCGAQPVGGVSAVPVQATVWGLARTFAVEHPELWGGAIDIDSGGSADMAAAILAEISVNTGEDAVALRGSDRLVCRLAPSPRLPAAETSFREDGAYLITGGTGGMALKVVRWMAERGARHISLAARREPAANVAAVMNAIQTETGAQLSFVRADVSDEGQMAAVVTSLRGGGRALRGVMHCAGVFDDRVLLNHDWTRFERVLAPKVRGAWILHELTKSDPLDFFVLFSSAASVLPGSGLANYAAANAFLDGLAHYRRSLGQPALSIDWCPWADTGMAEAVGGAREGQWNQAGLSPITSQEGLAVLSQTLCGPAPQYAVLPIDWTKYLQRFAPGARPGLLSDVAPAVTKEAAPSSVEPFDGLRSRVESALAAQRHEVILAHVRDRVSEVLGFGGGQRIDPERGLFDIGLDSLTAVELKNVLQKSVGQPLPSTLVFDYPSVQTLSAFIAREVFHLEVVLVTEERDMPAVAVDDDRQQLSEDELADLLVQKLSRMQS